MRAAILLVFGVLLVKQSKGNCVLLCNTETCGAEGLGCIGCDPGDDCAPDPSQCSDCQCDGCDDADTCDDIATTGAAFQFIVDDCADCVYVEISDECIPNEDMCHEDCVTCTVACADCETKGCVYSETGGDQRLCDCDCGNASACGDGCTDPPICHATPAGDGCMCVPDCSTDTDCAGVDCSTTGGACELNDQYTECQCAAPTCDQSADCNDECPPDSGIDEICVSDGIGGCECVVECDLTVNTGACGGSCDDLDWPSCLETPDGTGCMCKPDCAASQPSDCGPHGYDCSGRDCVLSEDHTDCVCFPELTTDDPSTTDLSTTDRSTTADLSTTAGAAGTVMTSWTVLLLGVIHHALLPNY